MGFYNTYVMPRMVDLACGMKDITEQRLMVVPQARGTVVEIGIGSGLNLPHYNTAQVDKVIGVDPDDAIWKRSEARRAAFDVPLERIGLSGEDIPLADGTADTVLVTYSLCTIPDPVTALREMRRVLRPGGALLFLEHGKAPSAAVQKWQARIDPVWKRIAGGCHSGRDIPQLLGDAGWSIDQMNEAYLPKTIGLTKPLSYNYWGSAH